MNVYALMLLLTPIVGAIGGWTVGKEYSVLLSITGIILGLIIGIGVYYGSIYLISFLGRVSGSDKSEKLNAIQWFESFSSALLIPLANPFISFFLTSNIVKLIGAFTSG